LRSFKALIDLTRPVNILITGLTVYVGGAIAGKDIEYAWLNLLVAAISAGLIAAGANALNDYYDVAIDLINRPDRPIPSGRIGRSVVPVWGGALIITGIVAGLILGWVTGVIAVTVALILWLYDSQLKQTFIWGNFAVALAGGAAFVYGGAAIGRIVPALIPAGFAFMIHFAREIVKDIEDMDGDRVALARTLPLVKGSRFARVTAAVLLILLALATILPYLYKIYSIRYLILVVFTVFLPVIFLSGLLASQSGNTKVRFISQSLKIIMITGLISLYVG